MTIPPNSPFQEIASRAELPSANVLDALRQDLAKDTSARRVLSLATRTTLSACALLLGVGLSAFSRLRTSPDAVVLSAAAFGLGAAALLLAGAIPTGGGARMGLFARRALVAVLTVALFTVLVSQASHFLGFSELEAQHYHKVMNCFEHALLSGVVAAGALIFLWRRSDPFSPRLTGAFLGLVGGLVGTLSIGLVCANEEGLHLTLGHGLAALILSASGAYAGSKWLAP